MKNVEILTPVGRLVQGDVFEAQTKDMEGNLLTIKTGTNAGQPRVIYFMAIAVPKIDPGINAVLNTILETARAAFPIMFDIAGNCTSGKFAFKFADGDLTPEKEGFAGCWVLKFAGGFTPKCFTRGGESIITDRDAIKRGYYVRIYGTVAGNGSNIQPGVFLNPTAIELVGYGEEINVGVNGKDVFGSVPAGLPVGASQTPIAPPIPLAVSPAPVAVGPAVIPQPAPVAVGPAVMPQPAPVAVGPAVIPQPAVPLPVNPSAPAPVMPNYGFLNPQK